MKTTLTKVSNSLPAPVVTFIQVVVSVGISYLVAWITTAVPHIHGPWVVIYGAAVALYYSAVAAAERASQATFLPELIQLVVGIALIEAFFIYCLQDYGSGSSAGYWGLVDRPPPSGPDADSNPKPSFAAVQALIATLTQLGAS